MTGDQDKAVDPERAAADEQERRNTDPPPGEQLDPGPMGGPTIFSSYDEAAAASPPDGIPDTSGDRAEPLRQPADGDRPRGRGRRGPSA